MLLQHCNDVDAFLMLLQCGKQSCLQNFVLTHTCRSVRKVLPRDPLNNTSFISLYEVFVKRTHRSECPRLPICLTPLSICHIFFFETTSPAVPTECNITLETTRTRTTCLGVVLQLCSAGILHQFWHTIGHHCTHLLSDTMHQLLASVQHADFLTFLVS